MSTVIPQTPQRPTPGAYINTPAPSRAPLFRAPSTQQTSGPLGASQSSGALAPAHPTQPTQPTLTPIERAARTINDTLAKESRYPELEAYVGQGLSSEYDLPANAAWTPFQKVKTYDIPDRIFEQYNHTQVSVRMGLFAEINHAWMCVDNQFYLWDYTHPNPELIGYEDQPHTINAVKLVVPRPKVFVDSISHVLVVATTTDIILLGVACQRGPEGVHTVNLYKTGMQVSIKGISVSCIAGSPKHGRIFFSDGRDSHDVYEITYQQEERWFASKCAKINHTRKTTSFPSLTWKTQSVQEHVVQMVVDDSRNLLYTLSSTSTIRVYHLKTATTLELVITRPLSQIRTNCGHMVRQTDLLFTRDMKIVSINPISAREAGRLSLMATTSTGCRIYFSSTSGTFYTESTAAPTSMQVQHIRFPPPDTNQPSTTSSSNELQPYQGAAPISVDSRMLVKSADAHRLAPGMFFSFVERTEGGNHDIFMSAPDPGRIVRGSDPAQGSRFIETAQWLPIGGLVQDLGLVTAPVSAASSPIGFGNELAVQFDKPVPEVALLTENGIHTIRRRRLVDMFASTIKYRGGDDGLEGELRKFTRVYGTRETSATALAVACGQGSDVGPDSRITKLSDADTVEWARKAFIEFGGRPSLNENFALDGTAVDSVRPSPRHDGIALYVSRLVRSIWKEPITRDTHTALGGLAFVSSTPNTKLQGIQKDLVQLQNFLEENKSFIEGLAGPEALNRLGSRQEEVELQGENRALTSLVQLISNIVEGISFVLVLIDENLDGVVRSLPIDTQQRVRQLTFEGLFCSSSGRELAKDLVKAIVNQNISKGSNVEQVAESLRRRCGSFCSSEDVVIFKAQENLKKAADKGANTAEGRSELNNSLVLFQKVAGSLSMEHLTMAVDQYIQLEFYAGSIRLALDVAKQLDRGNRALSWIKDGMPSQDARRSAYESRTKCYNLIHQVIQAVDRASSGRPEAVDGILSNTARRRNEAYNVINDSEDEVFQTHLYDWYLQQGWSERLLEIKSPYVASYLQRKSLEDIAHADLLWRYYAHYHNYLDAATVQTQLAKSGFDLSLERRIEYLSRARANASTRITGISEIGSRGKQSRQELLRDISDLLDVAKIQDDILEEVKSDPRFVDENRAKVIGELDGQILSLDELYNAYADQAGYYSICLLIYQAADHRDLQHVRATWTNLIQQKHEKAIAENKTPWEVVAENVRELGRRVNLSEIVFPVNILLSLLLQYHITQTGTQSDTRNGFMTSTNPFQRSQQRQQATDLPAAPQNWVVDLFISLNVPFESIISTLEALWYSTEYPFNAARNKKLLVKWIIYTVEKWGETSIRNDLPYGGENSAIGAADVLRTVLGAGRELAGEPEWMERGRRALEDVERAV